MSGHEHERFSPEGGHEPTELNVRPLLMFLAGLVGMTAVVMVILAGMMSRFTAVEKKTEIRPAWVGDDRDQFQGPKVTADQGIDMRRLRGEQMDRLGSYGWADRKSGVGRIPIRRAIGLVAAKIQPPAAKTGGPVTP